LADKVVLSCLLEQNPKVLEIQEIVTALLATTVLQRKARGKGINSVKSFAQGSEEEKTALKHYLMLMEKEARNNLVKLVPSIGEMAQESDVAAWSSRRTMSQLSSSTLQLQIKAHILKELAKKSVSFRDRDDLKEAILPLLAFIETAQLARSVLNIFDREELELSLLYDPSRAVMGIIRGRLVVPQDKRMQIIAQLLTVSENHPELKGDVTIAIKIINLIDNFHEAKMEAALLRYLSSQDSSKAKTRVLEEIATGQAVFLHFAIRERIRETLGILEKTPELSEVCGRALQKLDETVPGTVHVDPNEELIKTQLELENATAALAAIKDKVGCLVSDEPPVESASDGPDEIVNRLRRYAFEPNLVRDPYLVQDLPGYTLLRRIGSGAAAEVFTAINREGKYCVIKRVHQKYLNYLDSPKEAVKNSIIKLLRFFDREATLMERLDHPNLMKVVRHVVETEQPGRVAYYEAEYVRGGVSLRDLVTLKGPLSEEESVMVLYNIVLALEAASDEANDYANAVIHRDLKPENVLLTPYSSRLVKVIDLGLARVPQDETITQPGEILGSYSYLAPEAASGRGFMDLDQRGDIFALSIILFVMLKGQLPRDFFAAQPGDDPQQSAINAYSRFKQWATALEPTFTDDQLKCISKPLSGLLEKMGEKDPEQRINRFGVIRKAIEDIFLSNTDKMQLAQRVS